MAFCVCHSEVEIVVVRRYARERNMEPLGPQILALTTQMHFPYTEREDYFRMGLIFFVFFFKFAP